MEHNLPTQARQPVPTCGYRVVNTYPHDPTAFTQGLVYDRGVLYESTGLKGRSSLRKVELETGKVLQIQRLENRYFGEGLALWRDYAPRTAKSDRLIQLTWLSQTGFVYDLHTFKKLNTFTYATEGWGLTYNGKELIKSDGSDTLYFLDPDTFQEIRRIRVSDNQKPIENLNELEYVRGEILANVWLSDRIARISPQTGQIKGWIDLTGIIKPAPIPETGAVLNGIAYDASQDRLFVTGKLWDRLFEIEILCE